MLAFAVSVVALTGCHSEEVLWGGPVSGSVAIENKPLPHGAVTFIGTNGHAKNCEIINGKYEIPSPPMGVCQIIVMSAPKVDDSGTEIVGSHIPIPVRYAKPKESGLTFTVTTDPQTHNIVLSK